MLLNCFNSKQSPSYHFWNKANQHYFSTVKKAYDLDNGYKKKVKKLGKKDFFSPFWLQH